MLKLFLPAAIALLIAISPASALPTGTPLLSAVPSVLPGLVLIQYRDSERREGNRGRDDDGRRYTPGRRYNSAPPGWNRHGNRRPGDWRSRRCIMVGPIWFCP